MLIQKIPPSVWSTISENAHLVVFGESKPSHWDRFDYALVAEEDGMPLGYVTVRELDAESAYWQYGGTFPSARNTPKSWAVMQQLIEWNRERYKRLSMLIENTNTVMLKFAMKAGLRIMGIRNYRGSILLEHVIVFTEET